MANTTVVLFEKPDQARKHGAFMGIAQQNRGYLVAKNGWILTHAIGHLAELLEPDEISPEYKRWTLNGLPIRPGEWRYKAVAEKKEQYKVVIDLLKKADEIIIATDCGREGELIARELIGISGNTKAKLQRFWASSLDEESLRKAWNALRNGREFDGLYLASLIRQRCDWLWGMNLSRAATLALAPPKVVYPIGRVQTPVVALVVWRHLAIKNFVPKDYFELSATIATQKGTLKLRYAPRDDEKRIKDRPSAQAMADRATGATGPLQVEKNTRKETPPPFPRLSDLQKEANRRWSWSLDKTLDVAQELYDAEYATYPRTDSTKMPTEQIDSVVPILQGLIQNGMVPPLSVTGTKEPIYRKDRFVPDAVIQEESEHHAILPTLNFPSMERLSADQQKLYGMIAFWFIRAISPDYGFSECVVSMNANGVPLKATGKTPLQQGFKALSMKHAADADAEQEPAAEDQNAVFPPLDNGDQGRVDKVEIEAKKTTPPAYYTEASLLDDMMSIHKFVENPAYKARLKEKSGLGTEATRAATVKDLRKRKLIIPRGKKQIDAPPATIAMIQRLPKQLVDPGLTAVWEDYMEEVRHGRADFNQVMAAIEQMIAKHVSFFQNLGLNEERASNDAKFELKLEHNGHKANCPECSKPMGYREGQYGGFWSCSGYPDCTGRLKADPTGKPLPPVQLQLGAMCPKCKKKPLAMRTGPRGQFWACTGFPKCKHTEEVPAGTKTA
ncbi:TPA: topoisomerase DNA-binding C4 zinc finger domain-containing protein [Pseudomonas aeruginosa]|nr:topoisomerase DNA-binding C4 zinc finger domain-containing protein [Pseudomonas aeruginosa]